jgi:hypothetical protein
VEFPEKCLKSGILDFFFSGIFINCSGIELKNFFFVAFDERIKKIIGAACRNA